VREFLRGELKDEILGEALGVAAHLLVKSSCLDAIERGEVGVEHDALAAQDEDAAGDGLDRNQCCVLLADDLLPLAG